MISNASAFNSKSFGRLSVLLLLLYFEKMAFLSTLAFRQLFFMFVLKVMRANFLQIFLNGIYTVSRQMMDL